MKKILRTVLISMAVLLMAMVSLASCGKRTYSVTFKSGTETVAVAETDKEGKSIPGIRGMRGRECGLSVGTKARSLAISV